ncbi:MAG: fibronectin type III domain-containing protein, partial [Nitrospirae bacterium]|nr:fibronectin type III domain-containing protein [Nitrospirota bacterium]
DLTILAATSSTVPPPTTTVSVSLGWNLEADPSVVGYYLHYGLQSPNLAGSCTYTQSTYYPLASLNASSPTATVSGLASGTIYFFAVSAYNGRESACSNEVSKLT